MNYLLPGYCDHILNLLEHFDFCLVPEDIIYGNHLSFFMQRFHYKHCNLYNCSEVSHTENLWNEDLGPLHPLNIPQIYLLSQGLAVNVPAGIKQLVPHVCVFRTELLLSTKCLNFDSVLLYPFGLTVLAW